MNQFPIRIVDAHAHIFPPEVAAKRSHYARYDHWFQLLYQSPAARLASAEDLIESMDRSGVAHAIVCGFPWSDPELCAMHNQYMLQACEQFPSQLSWLAIVSPQDASAAGMAVDAISQGARGIGELNADAQRFIDDDVASLRACFDAVAGQNCPILIHASEPVGHRYPGKGTADPVFLLKIAAAFPELRICAAHWGGGLPFFELMPEVRELTRNIVYDTAASTYLYRSEIFQHLQGITGSDRILFASDFPVLGQQKFVQTTLNLPWPDNDSRCAILADNAIRFYGLSLIVEDQL